MKLQETVIGTSIICNCPEMYVIPKGYMCSLCGASRNKEETIRAYMRRIYKQEASIPTKSVNSRPRSV